MASVTARRDGRYELRESVRTGAGPRSRTLATFRVLTDDILDRAVARASRPVDREAIRRRAQALGVPDGRQQQAQLARALMTQLRREGRPAGPWARLLADELRTRGRRAPALPDTLPPLVEWLGSDARARGDALRELLRMTDRIPATREPRPLAFPRIDSSARAA
jgi:hypothetical protein